MLNLSLGLLVLITGLTGCTPEAENRQAFRLPDGNVELGKQAFIQLACHQCHTVDKVDLPDPGNTKEGLNLHLGGKIHYVKNYGDLLISITNPEHLISEHYPCYPRGHCFL